MESNKNAFKNQMLFGICDGLSSLVMGTTLGYTSSSLVSMYKDSNFEITENQGNWIGSIVHGMALLGSISSNLILESIGRRQTMILCSIMSITSWFMIGISSNVYQVIGARLCSGLFLGLQQVAISVYVSETVHPKMRPLFGIFPAIAGTLGFMVINIIPETMISWRGLAKFGSLLSLPLMLLLLKLSDSPFYLLKKGKSEKAFKCLLQLRESRVEVEAEFKALEENSKQTKLKKLDTMVNLFSPPNRWPVVVAILLHVFQPLTGFITLSSFMGIVFEESKSSIGSNVASFALAIVNMGSIVLMAKLPSLYSRKTLITWSSKIIIAGHLALSCYLFLHERNFLISNLLTIVPFMSFLAYGIGFSLAWGPIPWMFIGDGLPLKIRGETASLIIGVNWGFNFIVSKTFNWLALYLGLSGLVAFYAIATSAAMLVMQKYIPETFGFTAKQLDSFYEKSYKKKNI